MLNTIGEYRGNPKFINKSCSYTKENAMSCDHYFFEEMQHLLKLAISLKKLKDKFKCEELMFIWHEILWRSFLKKCGDLCVKFPSSFTFYECRLVLCAHCVIFAICISKAGLVTVKIILVGWRLCGIVLVFIGIYLKSSCILREYSFEKRLLQH